MTVTNRLARAKFHFVGIGGIGMCGLAELLHNMGATVTGSDLHASAQTEHLEGLGIAVAIGHAAKNVKDPDVVVYSSAVGADNVEIQVAKEKRIPVIPRAEALGEIMRLKRGVAVAGTHGKTTTTSLIASVFMKAEADPTIVVGGRLDLIKSTAQLGQGPWLIAEADESDGSFSRLSPEIVLVTNIDNDHLDHYQTFDCLKKAFFDFASRVPFYGFVLSWGDDPQLRQLFTPLHKRIVYYGFNANNDYRLEGQNSHYNVYHGAQLLGQMKMPMPGRHNALNALAALICGLEVGFDFQTCAEAIAQFGGVDRRFQHVGLSQGIDYFDDYGHHPTEISSVLSAFREKYPQRRLVVLFQPHRYSRTKLCWSQFSDCFSECDRLFITDIYAAGEAAIDGIDSEKLSAAIRHSHCRYLPHVAESLAHVKSELQPGDIVLTLGAGDIWKWGSELAQAQGFLSPQK